MVTWNSIDFDHPWVGILGIPKFMLISCVLKLFSVLSPTGPILKNAGDNTRQ